MMQTALRDRFTRNLLHWLNATAAPPGVVIEADTPLFADGLIDSLRILELIAWTERAVGSPIPDEMIRMDHFHSVARIAERFLEEVESVER